MTLSLGIADELDGENTELIEFSWRFAGSPLPLSDKLELLAGHIRARDADLLNDDISYVGLGVRKYWLPILFSGFSVVAASKTKRSAVAINLYRRWATHGGTAQLPSVTCRMPAPAAAIGAKPTLS